MMNLLNDQKLAQRLKANEVPAKECFYYFLIMSLYMTFLTTSFIAVEASTHYHLWHGATDFSYLTFVFFGTILVYRTSKQGDNKKFIEKFICLSVPIVIHLMLTLILIYALYNFFDIKRIIGQFFHETFEFTLSILYNVYFYLRLNYLMKIASH